MQTPREMPLIRGNLHCMGKRQIPQLVAAAQRLVNTGMSVKLACRRQGISVSAFYSHGGRSARTSADDSTARDAARDMLREEKNARETVRAGAPSPPPLGLRGSGEDQTIEVCGTDTGVDALQFAVTCFAVNSGDADEAILVSGQGMVTLSRREDELVSVQFCDWEDGNTIEVVGRPGDISDLNDLAT